jgi:sulfur-carrier protein
MPIVKLYANLRKLAGIKELSITGPTVGAVVDELVRQKPPVGDILIEGGKLRQHIVVTLNGHNVLDLETPVTEQDTVAIFPPIAGGTSPLTPLLISFGDASQREAV